MTMKINRKSLLCIIPLITLSVLLLFPSSIYAQVSQRDLDWEDDIRHFTELTLNRHPLLTPHTHAWSLVLPQHTSEISSLLVFDIQNPEILERFTKMSDNLIRNIPNLTDFEIIDGLRAMVRLLNDSHTHLSQNIYNYMFPICTFHAVNGYLHIFRAPAEHERAVFARLLAVNGVETCEIIRRYREIVPSESDTVLLSMYGSGGFRSRWVFQTIGIMGDEMTAVFTFEDLDGYVFDAEIEVLARNDLPEELLPGLIESGEIICRFDYIDRNDLLKHSRECNYWFEYFEEHSMMYMRSSRLREMMMRPSRGFYRDLAMEIERLGRVDRVVFDIRWNRGGFMPNGFAFFMQRLTNFVNDGIVGQVYILIDHHTYSNAITKATLLRNQIPGALLVGTPAMGPPNFFGGVHSEMQTLPNNSHVFFTVSSIAFRIDPDYPYENLMPDIIIGRTIEDFLTGRDPVLEAVSGGLQGTH